MKFYAVNIEGKIMGVANFPDEVAQFVERIDDNGPTTWTGSGQQITLDGNPTGWKIMKERAC